MAKPSSPLSVFPVSVWVLFLVVSVLLVWHLPHPFFFYDEWDLLDEFVSGRADLFQPHNEHLYLFGKPLFFFLASSFASALWVPYGMLLLVHAVNAWMVGGLAARASGERRMGLAAAFIFALHPFHVDNLSMLIQISALIQQTLFLLSLHGLLSWIRERRERWYVAVLVLQILQIGWFGTSLTSNVLTVLVAAVLFSQSDIPKKRLLPLALGTCLSVGLYWSMGGYRIQATMAATIAELVRAVHIIAVAWAENLPRLSTGFVFHPPLIVVLLVWGLLCGLFFAWRRRVSRERYASQLPWLVIGSLLYLMYLVPIGLTRHSFGVDIGIATRYTYYYLPGILLIGSVLLGPWVGAPERRRRISVAVLFACYILGSVVGARYAIGIWDARNVMNRENIAHGGESPVYTAHPSLSARRMQRIWEALQRNEQ